MYARSRNVPALAAVIAVTVALAGCDIAVNGDGGFNFDIAAGKAQDTWTRSYPLGKDGRIEIININGRISAEATDGANVEVLAERTAKASSDDGAKELLKQIEMREEVGTDRVRVEVRVPRNRAVFHEGPNHEVKWTIKVPRGVAVDLRTVNGGVRLNALEGDIRARTTNGGITGNDIQATGVDASTTNGGVEIELARPVSTGSFELQAVNGGVSLMMPADSKADLAAKCVNGGISLQGLDVKVNSESTSNPNEFEQHVEGAKKFRRRLDGQLNGGGARVLLETVNGGVKILRTGDAAGTRD